MIGRKRTEPTPPDVRPRGETGAIQREGRRAEGVTGFPQGAEDVLGKAYDARLMARLWGVTRPHRRLVFLSLGLFPLAAAVELCQPYLIKVAIDAHILKRDWVGVGRMAAIFLASLVVLYALRTAQTYVMQLTGQRVIHDLRDALFVHLQRLDAAFFDANPVGRLMTRVLNDVEAINELFVSGVVVVIGDVVTVLGVVAIMLRMNWRLALVTFALVPLLVLVGGYFRVKARGSYREVRARLARLNAFLQESIQGITVIQLFAREREEARIFGGLNAALRAAQFRSTFFESSLYAAVEAIGSAAVALLIWYGGGDVVSGLLTFGGLVAFLEYTSRFFLPIRDLGAKYTVMQAAMVSSERVFGLLDTRPAITRPSTISGGPEMAPAPCPTMREAPGAGPSTISGGPEMAPAPCPTMREAPGAGPSTISGGPEMAPALPQMLGAAGVPREGGPAVEFRGVWFAYHGEQWVLRDCSFAIGRGETVALVGPTGEGKTTIARLMMRAFDVSRGQVLVDGVDVREWETASLRRHVGLVPQEVFLFTGTVRENLTLGADGAVAAAEVHRALVRANAERLVESLPRGLDEEIRERGVNLSQGQRQLLAIARALIYNPRVLVLDEATSSIDVESEALIRSALAELLRGRASLVIAHRLSTIQSADRIAVLHRGAIHESGRHADLLAAGGVYSRLFELQFGPGSGT